MHYHLIPPPSGGLAQYSYSYGKIGQAYIEMRVLNADPEMPKGEQYTLDRCERTDCPPVLATEGMFNELLWG